jgi:hypothetical protein
MATDGATPRRPTLPVLERTDRMSAHAGERANKTGDFHCAKCSEVVHVKEGDKIPKCPNGHTEFATRTGEPGNKS